MEPRRWDKGFDRREASVMVPLPLCGQEDRAGHDGHELRDDHGNPDAVDLRHERGSRMDALWDTSVRRKEMSAEVRPSFSAVKKPEAKYQNP